VAFNELDFALLRKNFIFYLLLIAVANLIYSQLWILNEASRHSMIAELGSLLS